MDGKRLNENRDNTEFYADTMEYENTIKSLKDINNEQGIFRNKLMSGLNKEQGIFDSTAIFTTRNK
ncbi:MAG: hypothetical protein E7299_08780 [Lachnospiraceae bacterium]|nr:hypothetical protein [Lachnospiraceae bacterium]